MKYCYATFLVGNNIFFFGKSSFAFFSSSKSSVFSYFPLPTSNPFIGPKFSSVWNTVTANPITGSVFYNLLGLLLKSLHTLSSCPLLNLITLLLYFCQLIRQVKSLITHQSHELYSNSLSDYLLTTSGSM